MKMSSNNYDYGRELLKWTAIITMTSDHIGAVLYPDYTFLRWIGRLSFPLFAYLLILGIRNTSNIKKYFIRLFIFALISQIPFFLAIDVGPFDHLNIFFTLSSGLIFVYYFRKGSMIAFFPIIFSSIFPFDYGIYGIATIGCMYFLVKNKNFGIILLILLNILFLIQSQSQFLSLLSLPLILLHNNGSLIGKIKFDKKSVIPIWRKYFFYFYYPLHLLILYFIKQIYF
jgi:hypothetical protein